MWDRIGGPGSMARYWRSVVPAVLAAVLGAACMAGAHAQAPAEPPAKAKKQDPVEAQRAIEAASKLLQSGRVDQAVLSLSATLAGGNLPPALMAQAFYVRGLADRTQKKPAHAISDLNSALWLKGGLGGEERADALKKRIEAYADAGLAESGQVLVAGGADPAPAKKSGNWLNNIFGSPEPAAPPPSRPKVAAAATERIETAAVPAKAPETIGGWASKTQAEPGRTVLAAPSAAKPAEPEAAPPEAAPPQQDAPAARGDGSFQVQLAPVRTKAEALALAARARREHASLLAASEPEIDQAVFGNMGSFYRVRFGPFASAQQTEAVCAKLKGGGLDCMPVPR